MAGATSVPVSWIEISSGTPPTPPAALISSAAISVAILLCSPHSRPLAGDRVDGAELHRFAGELGAGALAASAPTTTAATRRPKTASEFS
jgi:hypothetical protein